MLFNFIPASQAAEAAAQADAEERQRPRGHRPDGLTVFAARSPQGRGHLLISDAMVSLHPRRGVELVHTDRNVKLTQRGLRTRLLLADGARPVTVSMPRWQGGWLTRSLRAAGFAVIG